MAQKKGIPDRNVPFVDQQGRITPEWLIAFQPLFKKVATQDDAVAVSNPPTQAEVNAIVAVINALIDKLQAAGVME
jgi:hypothetical protein